MKISLSVVNYQRLSIKYEINLTHKTLSFYLCQIYHLLITQLLI